MVAQNLTAGSESQSPPIPPRPLTVLWLGPSLEMGHGSQVSREGGRPYAFSLRQLGLRRVVPHIQSTQFRAL